MTIYSYYLTKIHKFNEDGNPSFIMETDDDGNSVLSPKNYEIAFSRGEIYADPALSVADPINKSDYTIITTSDPYWIDDYNTQKTLNDATFNFNETKYIGVQTSFDLIKIAYENAYLFKMITDNKDITDVLTLNWIDMGISASILDIFIYLAALICKFYGYEGLISAKLPYTAALLGYDFQANATIIKDTINNNPYLRTNEQLKDKIRSMVITDTNSVNTVFSNMQEIESMIISGFINASSREEFNAYRELYNTLMTSKIIDEVYTDDSGKAAESFSSLLRYQSPDLYSRLISIAEEDIEAELTILVDKIDSFITSLKYAPHSLGMESSNLIDNLFRILRFFKSAKAEIIGYNVVYQISTRGINFFKLMDQEISFHDFYERTNIYASFDDFITKTTDFNLVMEESAQMTDELIDITPASTSSN